MNKNLDEQLLIMQPFVYTIKKDIDDINKKLNTHDSEFNEIQKIIKQLMIPNPNLSPYKMDSPKAQHPTTVVPFNKKEPLSEGGNSAKNGGMWDLKHEIRSPKLNDILIKI